MSGGAAESVRDMLASMTRREVEAHAAGLDAGVRELAAAWRAERAEVVRLRAAVDAALLTLKLPAPTEAHRNDEARAILRAALAGVEQEAEPT